MDTNSVAIAINRLLKSTQPPILKPMPTTPVIDDDTRAQLEEYAGANGLTLDEAVAQWLARHGRTFGYLKRSIA
jgi:hypothetical protein